MSGGPRIILSSLKCELNLWALILLGKLQLGELGGQWGCTRTCTQKRIKVGVVRRERGMGALREQDVGPARALAWWQAASLKTLGHSRASSAHRIGQCGQARFREFLPLTLPLELGISPAGACDIVLSPEEAMCGDNHSPFLPRKSGEGKGCSPQTGPPLAALSLYASLPSLPSPTCFHSSPLPPRSVFHSPHSFHLGQL